MKLDKKIIKKALAKLEESIPADNLIETYDDFKRERDVLHHYRFNPVILVRLLKLINELWKTDKRINRMAMIAAAKMYAYTGKQQSKEFTFPVRMQAFELMKKLFECSQYISPKQLEAARQYCNFILRDQPLTGEAEQWLCSYAFSHEIILNRVLRYPVKSKIISQWAKENFNAPVFRNRRAEHISWILDEDKDFEISEQLMIDDFEYLNHLDMEAIRNYENEWNACRLLETELEEYLPKKEVPDHDSEDLFTWKKVVDIKYPELKVTRRFYSSLYNNISTATDVLLGDLKNLREHFHENLGTYQKVTMVWALTYSRLAEEEKLQRLQSYFDKSISISFQKAAVKSGNRPLLEWLLHQA